MAKLLLHELRLRRGAIIGWGIGLAIFGAYMVILYPDFAEPLSAFNLEDLTIYQVLGDFAEMGTFRGFISAEMFTFLPVLLAIYAIVNGTGTIAGEEDNGTLEPTLALPIYRWQLLVSKIVALAIALFLILVIVAIGFGIAVNSLPADVDTGGVEVIDLAIATLGTWPILMFFATLSLFLGVYLPTRRQAATVATLILVVSYFGNNLSALVDVLKDIHFLFVFKYYNGSEMLANGLDSGDTLVLLGVSAVFLVLALLSFERRNVTVGAWPWQRAHLTE